MKKKFEPRTDTDGQTDNGKDNCRYYCSADVAEQKDQSLGTICAALNKRSCLPGMAKDADTDRITPIGSIMASFHSAMSAERKGMVFVCAGL